MNQNSSSLKDSKKIKAPTRLNERTVQRKQIAKEWLKSMNFLDKNVTFYDEQYLEWIMNAFLLSFLKKNESQNIKSIQNLQQEKQSFENLNQNQYLFNAQQKQRITNSLLSDHKEALVMYKKGKKLKKLVKRQIKIKLIQDSNKNEGSIFQFKNNKETKKNFSMRNNNLIVQEKLEFESEKSTDNKTEQLEGKVYDWMQPQSNYRLVISTNQYRDINIYAENLQESKKIQNLILTNNAIEKIGSEKTQTLLQNSQKKFQEKIQNQFLKKLFDYYQNILFKNSASLKKYKCLNDYDVNIMKALFQSWRIAAQDKYENEQYESQKARDEYNEKIQAKIRFLNGVHSLKNYDLKPLRTFVDKWKDFSKEKGVVEEFQEQELHLKFCDIEIHQNYDFIKPVLEIKLERISTEEQESLKEEGQFKELRIINNVSQVSTQGIYYQCLLDCRISGKINCNVIRWELEANEENQSNNQIILRKFDKRDQLSVRLYDDGELNEDTNSATAYFELNDFIDVNKFGKNIYTALDVNQKLKNKNQIVPFLHIQSFLKPSPKGYDFQDYQEYIEYLIQRKMPLNDPIYNEIIEIPDFFPQDFEFLYNFFLKKNLISEDLKYQIFSKNSPEENLRKIRQILFENYISQLQKNHSMVHKNYDIIIDLCEELMENPENLLELQANEQQSEIEQFKYQEQNSSENLSQQNYNESKVYNLNSILMSVLSKNHQYGSLEKLQQVCIRGIPIQYRRDFWYGMGNVAHLKENTLKVKKTMQYMDKQLQVNHDSENENFYQYFLDKSEKTDFLLKQEILDDIDKFNQKKNMGNVKKLQNILLAFGAWCQLMANDRVGNLSIAYSENIVRICSKLIAMYHLQNQSRNSIFFSVIQKHHKSNKDQNELFNQNAEDEIFWLLSAIASNVLQRYYDSKWLDNEEISVKKLEKESVLSNAEKKIEPKFPCHSLQFQGIKEDFLLLKVALKQFQKQLFQKFQELAIPLEFYFYNSFLSMFSDLFNNEMMFRIWDIMFFESQRRNSQKKHQAYSFLIGVALAFLDEQKEFILNAKNHNQVMIIIQTSGKFLDDIDAFIKKALTYQSKLIDLQENKRHLIDDLKKDAEQYFQNTFKQNLIMGSFVNKIWPFESVLFSVDIVQIFKLLNKFHDLYISNKLGLQLKYQSRKLLPDNINGSIHSEFKQENLEQNDEINENQLKAMIYIPNIFKIQKNKFIHIFIHKLILFWNYSPDLSLEIIYGSQQKQRMKIIVDTVLFLNHYEQFTYEENCNHIEILIYEESRKFTKQKKMTTQPNLIKKSRINLNGFLPDYLCKSVQKLEEVSTEDNFNYVTSEIEFSLILSTKELGSNQSQILEMNESQRQKQYLGPSKLLQYFYQNDQDLDLKALKLESFYERFQNEIQNSLNLTHCHNASFSQKKDHWKSWSSISYENFKNILHLWENYNQTNLDMALIYNSLIQTNQEKKFYFIDFLMIVVLFNNATFRQKVIAIFNIVCFFQSTKKIEKHQQIELETTKKLINWILELFLVYLPHDYVDNLVDQILLGSKNGIIKGKLQSLDKSKMIDLTTPLKKLEQFKHLNYYSKDIRIGDADLLDGLSKIVPFYYNQKDLKEFFSYEQNPLLTIQYIHGGMFHRLKLIINSEWQVQKKTVMDSRTDIPFDRPPNYKASENILYNNENVIPLTNYQQTLNIKQFIYLMEQLPMLKYLTSFKNLNQNQEALHKFENINLLEINFNIYVNRELMMKIIYNNENYQANILENITDNIDEENEKFNELVYEFEKVTDQLSENQYLIDQITQTQSAYQTEINQIEMKDLQFYQSISKNIKKIFSQIIREILFQLEKLKNQQCLNESWINPEIFKVKFLHPKYKFLLKTGKLPKNELLNYSFFDLYQLYGSKSMQFSIDFDSYKEHKKTIHQQLLINEIRMFQHLKALDQEYNQLAIYRYSDHSSEWLPCKIEKKYLKKNNKSDSCTSKLECSYFGVVFKQFSNKLYLKKPNEIILSTFIDIDEIPIGKLQKEQQWQDLQGTISQIQSNIIKKPESPLKKSPLRRELKEKVKKSNIIVEELQTSVKQSVSPVKQIQSPLKIIHYNERKYPTEADYENEDYFKSHFFHKEKASDTIGNLI